MAREFQIWDAISRSLRFMAQPVGPSGLRIGAILSGLVAFAFATVMLNAAIVGSWADFDIWAASIQLAALSVVVFVIACSAHFFVRRDGQADFVATLIWALALIGFVSACLMAVAYIERWIATVAVCALCFYVILSISWSFAYRGKTAAARGATGTVVLLFGAVWGGLVILPIQPMFSKAEDFADAAYIPVDLEALYYAQPALMAQQTDKLRKGDPTD